MTLQADLRPADLPAEPGELARSELTVRNAGTDDLRVAVEIVGEPSEWVWANPVELDVPAGGQATARVMFRPPRGSGIRAGSLPVTVRVKPHGGEPAEARATVEIAPVHELSAVLDPRTARDRRTATYSLSIDNRGNAPARVTARVTDASGVRVEVDPPEVDVEPGGSARSAVTVSARRPLLRGTRARRFALDVVTGRATATASGTFEQEASLPPWAGWVAGGLAAVLVGAFALQALAPTEDPGDLLGVASPATAPASEAAVDVDPSCPTRDHVDPGAGIRFLDDREREPRDRDATPPDDYAFLSAGEAGCQPVRFNPCELIRYVIGGDPPEGGANDAHEAIARISEATGLQFLYGGETDEGFGRRSPYQPDRYGERWPPLLIAFEHQGTDAARGDEGSVIAGTGVPTAVGDVLVTAQMSVNVDAIIDLETRETVPGGFGPGITRGRILLHELGHSIGLGHVANPDQIMHEPLTDHPPVPAAYGEGDLVGLRYVGDELGCLETPPVPDEALPPPRGHATPSPPPA